MNAASLLFALVLCTLMFALLLVLHQMDIISKWIHSIFYVIMTFVSLSAFKYVVLYLHTNHPDSYSGLESVFWVCYFCEHLAETVMWTIFAAVLQVRRGRRFQNDTNLIHLMIILCFVTIGLCLVMLATLFLADDVGRTIKVLRQVSFMLAICSAVLEYSLMLARAALLRDDWMLFRPRQILSIMLLPSFTLASSVAVCGIPEFDRSIACTMSELAHMFVFSGTLCGVWYYIMIKNAECTQPGGPSCPSQLQSRFAATNSENVMHMDARPHWTRTPVEL